MRLVIVALMVDCTYDQATGLTAYNPPSVQYKKVACRLTFDKWKVTAWLRPH